MLAEGGLLVWELVGNLGVLVKGPLTLIRISYKDSGTLRDPSTLKTPRHHPIIPSPVSMAPSTSSKAHPDPHTFFSCHPKIGPGTRKLFLSVIFWKIGSGLGSAGRFKGILDEKFSRPMLRLCEIVIIYSISLENNFP